VPTKSVGAVRVGPPADAADVRRDPTDIPVEAAEIRDVQRRPVFVERAVSGCERELRPIGRHREPAEARGTGHDEARMRAVDSHRVDVGVGAAEPHDQLVGRDPGDVRADVNRTWPRPVDAQSGDHARLPGLCTARRVGG
jgi:hypothetical protein